MSIKLKIQKRQWLILFLVLCLPLLLNAMAIWLKFGTSGTLHLLGGTYHPSNPNLPFTSFKNILSELLQFTVLLGFIGGLVIFVSNMTFFQKQQISVKILEAFIIVLFVAKVFEIVSGFIMPIAWLSEFIDSLGVPGSQFTAYWSRWFIFPITAIFLFIAIIAPQNEHLGKIFKLTFLGVSKRMG